MCSHCVVSGADAMRTLPPKSEAAQGEGAIPVQLQLGHREKLLCARLRGCGCRHGDDTTCSPQLSWRT